MPEMNMADIKSKRGRPPKRGAGPNLTQKQIREELDGLVRLANSLVGYTPYAEYALIEEEIIALRDALALEIETNASVLIWVQRVGKMSPHLILASTILGIVVRRLPQVKGSIPVDFGSGEDGRVPFASVGPDYNPFPVGTGSAYGDDRGHGNGQDVPSEPSNSEPTVHDHAAL